MNFRLKICQILPRGLFDIVVQRTLLFILFKQETLVHAPKLWAEEISKRALLFP